jgi:hypothetical protein
MKTMTEPVHAKLKLAFEYYRALPDGTTIEDVTAADLEKFGKCMNALGELGSNENSLLSENEPAALACLARHYPKMPKGEIRLWWKMTRTPPMSLIAD